MSKEFIYGSETFMFKTFMVLLARIEKLNQRFNTVLKTNISLGRLFGNCLKGTASIKIHEIHPSYVKETSCTCLLIN